MGVISLADFVADEGEAKRRETDNFLRDKFPKPAAEDVSPCYDKPVDYSLGKGNPVCSGCGMPIYS